MEASITLKKVGKLVGDKTILASLTFGIEKGSLVAIIGDNEAGKSMLLRVISGIEYQEYGQIFINGLDSQKRRNKAMLSLGFVPHELDLDPWLTLEENIRFIGMLYGESTETINTRMIQLSRELHITTYLKKMVKDISPGIIKKGMIIRALIHDPEMVLLDEPASGLDPRYTKILKDWIKNLAANGRTVLLSTHIIEMAENLCTKVAIIDKGQLLAVGTIQEIQASTGVNNLEDAFIRLIGD